MPPSMTSVQLWPVTSVVVMSLALMLMVVMVVMMVGLFQGWRRR